MEPLNKELQESWNIGFALNTDLNTLNGRHEIFRMALICIAYDIPVHRKLCGFLGMFYGS